MHESDYIWMNGAMVPWKESNTHFLSHALHYGSAVFEGIRCYATPSGPAVFRLAEHIERLFYSAKLFGMTIPHTPEEMTRAVHEVIQKNNLTECYIRPIAYIGYGNLGFDISKIKVEAGVAAWRWEAMLGKESVTHGIKMKISSFVRPSSDSMPVKAKVSGNYANSIMAKMEAMREGYDDAILLDNKGFISECSAENFFMIHNGQVITPTTSNCLSGITRKSIMEIAADLNLTVVEKDISPKEAMEADECFATGTAAEVIPIVSIQKNEIGNGKPGEITKRIQSEYYKAIHGESEKYHKWLAYVPQAKVVASA